MRDAIQRLSLKNRVTVLLLIVSSPLTLSFSFVANGKDAEQPVKKKAVLETSKTEGFKLSEKAIRTIGLISKSIESAPEFRIPEKALVQSLDRVAVYRLRGDWYKLLSVVVVRKNGSELVVRSQEIKPGSDRVVTNGIELLRATEMEAFGGEE